MSDFAKHFQEVLTLEAKAISRAASMTTSESMSKLEALLSDFSQSGGRFICSGVGKSGLIAHKIASTLRSLGRGSYFLHPVEAMHGDLGMVHEGDVAILISYSGTTQELLTMLPHFPVPVERRIALTSSAESALASACGIFLDCSVEREACINNLAPTTSTTVALAMGDAIAVSYERAVGLNKEGFARNHPAGSLGKSLTLKAKHLMVERSECAILSDKQSIRDALMAMTTFPVGLCVLESDGQFSGMMVEGDIRRALVGDMDLDAPVQTLMNTSPVVIPSECSVVDALELMEGGDRPLNVLPVVDGGIFKGALRLHDLFRQGIRRG